MRISRRGGRAFGMLWTIATAAGRATRWAIGAAAGEVEGGVVSAFCGGSLSGALQWQALRRRLSSASWWAAASVLGWAGGALVGLAVESATAGAVERTLGASIALALVTTMQWMYLRRRAPRSGWWFIANVAALGVGSGAVLAISALIGAPMVGAPGGAILGLGIGATTGTALVWLLNGARCPTDGSGSSLRMLTTGGN